MADAMMFPDTVEEFMESYKMVDDDHVYSNGIEYVPIFRMEQWFEHEKTKNNGWISVNERLPEKDGAYLVVIKFPIGGHIHLVWDFVDGEWYKNLNVAYWMPLPEFPEEVKK